jgi:hypothetical protein
MIRVKISPAALEYLEGLAAAHRARMLLRALPYCEVNERPRVQSFDFAMAQGARTQHEVDEWHRANRVRSRSTKLPRLDLPYDAAEDTA